MNFQYIMKIVRNHTDCCLREVNTRLWGVTLIFLRTKKLNSRGVYESST
jgi:hypothetical protein